MVHYPDYDCFSSVYGGGGQHGEVVCDGWKKSRETSNKFAMGVR